ncbi:MAG: UpxY family transcription antiterminator [Thermodesulfobacteriota bacterium]
MSNFNRFSTPSGKEWYAVYTVVRHEKAVNSALAEKEIETFLPLREVLSRWKDRKKRIQIPVFPGYLFVNIHLKEMWDVLNRRSVVRILGVKGIPIPVPVDQISAIKSLLESNLRYDPYPYFSEGREVIVINGPLQGIRGKIVEVRGNYRLILSVDLIQRSVSVEIDMKDVELV